MITPCLPCVAETHGECLEWNLIKDICCCPTTSEVKTTEPGTRTPKDNALLKDVESTGRKRAAQLYPLEKEMPCEWQGLKFAGGGVEPIIGCIDGFAVARHHGPDKDTVNNEKGNVHRICAKDHNRWHTKNDKYYGERSAPGESFLPKGKDCKPHDAETRATTEEFLEAELWWLQNPAKRTKEVEENE